MSEHEFEPVRGLPEPLPEGERILWQGSPCWQSLARRALHVGHVAAYFGVLLALRAAAVLTDGGSVGSAALAALTLVPLALAALAILATMAWLMGKTALYTLTDRRVVMRIGVVLTITFNIPFRTVESAAMHRHSDGTGDVALALGGGDRIAYLHLWPHARPWRVARPEPMLRSIAEPERVAEILVGALRASDDSRVRQPARPAAGPQVPVAGNTRVLATQ